MIKLNESPIEFKGRKWNFFGALYKYGSLDGSIEIMAKGPRNGHAIMVSQNLFDIGKSTKGPYFALHPELESKSLIGLSKIFKEMFCEEEETILNLWGGHRIIFKLKPEFEKMIRDDDKNHKEKPVFH